MVARRIEQIATLAGVQVKEDTGHDDDLLLQAGLEEVETVGNRVGQPLQVEPEVESRVGHELDAETDFAKAADDEIALIHEVALQSLHLGLYQSRLEHRDGRLLERNVGAAIEVGATAANGLDKLLGTQDPSYAPAGQAEALGQAVNDEDVIYVDVLDVLGGGNGRAVAVGGVVVAGVELVADQSGTLAAEVLDLAQFRIGDDAAGGVAWVGGDDDGSAAGDFLGDLLGVDVVAVFLRQRDGNGGEVLEERQHLVVGCIVGNEEADVGVVEDGGDADKTSAAAGNDAYVLPCVLGFFALAVHLVVEVGDGFAEGLDAGCGTILARVYGDVEVLGAGEAALDLVVDFRGALCDYVLVGCDMGNRWETDTHTSKVCPLLGLLKETMLAGLLGAPDDSGGGSSGIQASMRKMSMMEMLEWFV